MGAGSVKLIVQLRDRWAGNGLAEVSRGKEDKKVLKGNVSKNSRELRERSKVTKGKNSSGDQKGEVLDEPVEGDHKFPQKAIEIPNYL